MKTTCISLGMVLVAITGPLLRAEEFFLTDDQKRDRADMIVIMTPTLIETGSNYVHIETYTYTRSFAADAPQHTNTSHDRIQEWLIHYTNAIALKGPLPSESIATADENMDVICPHFDIGRIHTGSPLIVFGKHNGNRVRLLHNSNQSVIPITNSYAVSWFERTDDPDNPYVRRETNMLYQQYLLWLRTKAASKRLNLAF